MRRVAGIIASLFLFVVSIGMAGAENWITVRPVDNGKVLVNPKMGWTFHYYSNILSNYGSRLEPTDTLEDFPGLAVIYLRLPWSYIEPEEGVFNWSYVDTPAQRWIDRGLRVAFRFTSTESWMRYATPKWVQDAGAKGNNFTPGKLQADGPYWEPDYTDPVFLEKLDNFLAIAAARYDGDPNVDFIDVGSFGVWGEGHTIFSTRIRFSPDAIIEHIKLYQKHFKKTLLMAVDDFSFLEVDFTDRTNVDMAHNKNPQKSRIIDYAIAHGLGLRDDSILVQGPPWHYFSDKMAQLFWPNVPVVLENEHYGSSRDRGAWGDGSLYLQAVEDYHASYVSIHWWPREFLNEQRALIDKINLRLGYRLNILEISWPEKTTLDTPFTVAMCWANAGVAPCYSGGYIAITLKDEKDGIVSVFVDESFDVRTLSVGSPGKAPEHELTSVFRCADTMKPGTYDLYISIGSRDGTPKIALPLSGRDGNKRYRMGTIVVTQVNGG